MSTKMRRVTLYGGGENPTLLDKKQQIFNRYFIPEIAKALTGYIEDGVSEVYICLYHDQPVGALLFQAAASNSFSLFVQDLHRDAKAFISDAVATIFEIRNANKIRTVFTGNTEFDIDNLKASGFELAGFFSKEHLDESGSYHDVRVYEILNPKWNTVPDIEESDEDDTIIVGAKPAPKQTSPGATSPVVSVDPDVVVENGQIFETALVENPDGTKKDVMKELRSMQKVKHSPVTIPEIDTGAFVIGGNSTRNGQYARLQNQ